ncbi:hypothetical protein GGF39_000588 [Coemansia sp. RSA 1721]|nr:hypothetical protein GGF39_000588 [Coemansia sp. RSA 1721]
MLQLPYSVVQHIVAFAAVDNYRNPGAVICTTVKRTLNQLLNTSSSFRAAALDQLNCDMSISQKHEMLIFSKLACGTAEGEGVLEYKHVFDCVKTVDMMVDVSSLFFQDMLVNESEDFIRELVFPNVHTLELQIASTIGYDLSDIVENEEYKYADEETLEKKYKDNVSKFVLYAKNMLPNVRFFNLIMGGIAHTYSDEFPDIVDLVFEQFSGLAKKPQVQEDINWDVFANFSSLRVIELPDICIDLTAVCKLLSHVRCLRDLGAGNFELGSRFSHMSFPDIINTLQLESNPLNRHLNTLRVMDRYMFGYHSQSTGKETAMFAAALMQ